MCCWVSRELRLIIEHVYLPKAEPVFLFKSSMCPSYCQEPTLASPLPACAAFGFVFPMLLTSGLCMVRKSKLSQNWIRDGLLSAPNWLLSEVDGPSQHERWTELPLPTVSILCWDRWVVKLEASHTCQSGVFIAAGDSGPHKDSLSQIMWAIYSSLSISHSVAYPGSWKRDE